MDNKYPQNPNENQQPQNNEEKSNKIMKRLFQLVVILLLIIIIILLLLRSCGDGWQQQPTGPTGGGVGFDPNAGNDTKPDDPTTTKRPGVVVPGWPYISIPCDQLEVPVDFFNPEANAGWYHITFELRLPTDSGIGYEVLYTSGLVEAGKHIQKITLNRALPEGVYNAIIFVQPYRVEDHSPTNNIELETEITAKKAP